MLYDAVNYATQAQNVGTSNRKNKRVKGDEFLSGYSKENRLHPVITLVVYWGTKEWDGSRCLWDMMDTDDPVVRNFVTNYKMNLLIPGEINDFTPFVTSNKQVFEFMACSNDEQAMNALMDNNKEFKNVPVDVVNLLNACTGANLEFDETKEVVDMCKAWADHAANAAATATISATKRTAREDAINLLENGAPLELVVKCIKNLTKEEIIEIYNEVRSGKIQES